MIDVTRESPEAIPQMHRIRLLAEEVYAASRLGCWCLKPGGELITSTCPNEDDFYSFLQISDCFELIAAQPEGCVKPALFSDSVGMAWIAEHSYEESREPSLLFLLGPVFFSETSVKSIESSLTEQNLSLQIRLRMLRLIDKVPVMPQTVFRQYGIMLHHALTKKIAVPSDFLILAPAAETHVSDQDRSSHQTDTERAAAYETAVLKAVEEGNQDILKILDSFGNVGEPDVGVTGNALREGKNSAIISCALVCRAAITGGLSLTEAKKMESSYLSQIENCRLYTELISVHQEMLLNFTKQVRKSKEYGHLSPEIRECCSYIRSSVLNDITLADAAAHTGYTEYYLSRKFQKEVGIRINDFIKETKVDYAKMLLTATRKSIQEISDELNFSTRNYFSKVFHEITGKTPAEYRAQAFR